MFLVTLVCLKIKILMGMYFRDIFLKLSKKKKNSRGANNYGQHVLEKKKKNIYFIM